MQTHTTRGQFKTQLVALLDDPNKVHWTDIELNLKINETLRNWGAFGYFKERGQFIIGNANRFYDLTTSLRNISNELILEKTLTYGDLITSICYDLIESTDDVNDFDVFTQPIMLSTIDRRIDEFKLKTGLILSKDEFLLSTNSIDLGNQKLDFIRLAFKDVADDDVLNHKYYRLYKEDENNLQSFKKDFNLTSNRRPKYFSRVLGSSNHLRFYPLIENTGFLHLITIDSRDKNITLSTDTLLGIPDNFFTYLKFGVLADLLQSETPMKDLQRANYSHMRWNEGITIGKNYTSVLNAEINGRNCNLVTLEELDNFDRDWHNKTGVPNKVALAGYNLISTNKGVLEDTNIVLDVTQNALIPISDADFIEVKAEYIEALLNYCYHLCMFKEGFNDLNNSEMFLNQFGNMAMTYNAKLSKELVSFEMINKSKKQGREVPRFNRNMEDAATVSA